MSTQSSAGLQRTGRWPAALAGMLLILQAVALVVIGVAPGLSEQIAGDVFASAQADLSAEELAWFEQSLKQLSRIVQDRKAVSFYSQLLGLMGMVAGIGVLLRRASAWTLAMAVQGLNLLVAIVRYYLAGKPEETCLAMIASLLLVAHLNTEGVTAAFRRSRATERKGP